MHPPRRLRVCILETLAPLQLQIYPGYVVNGGRFGSFDLTLFCCLALAPGRVDRHRLISEMDLGKSDFHMASWH